MFKYRVSFFKICIFRLSALFSQCTDSTFLRVCGGGVLSFSVYGEPGHLAALGPLFGCGPVIKYDCLLIFFYKNSAYKILLCIYIVIFIVYKYMYIIYLEPK